MRKEENESMRMTYHRNAVKGFVAFRVIPIIYGCDDRRGFSRPTNGEGDVFTPAFAQSPAAAGPNDMLMQLVPFVFVLIIMYFLLIRPQQKRARAHQEMVKSLRRGDVVVMNSGMIGKISKVIDDAEVEVEIAENVRVRLLRAMIAETRSKPEPQA